MNDNAPSFKEDYRPVVMENGKPHEVLKIFAQDPDDTVKGNGPPFTFFMDSNADNITKSSFRVVQEEEGTCIHVYGTLFHNPVIEIHRRL